MTARRIVVVGMALLFLVALFPPRRCAERSPFVPPRAFYWNPDFSVCQNTLVELDLGRLFDEWGIILSAMGLVLAIFHGGDFTEFLKKSLKELRKEMAGPGGNRAP